MTETLHGMWKKSDSWIIIGEKQRPRNPREQQTVIGDRRVAVQFVRTDGSSQHVDVFDEGQVHISLRNWSRLHKSAPPTLPRIGDQPMEVHRHRIAPEIYDTLGDILGISPRVSCKIAELFGDDWDNTDLTEYREHIKLIGPKRKSQVANRIA